MNIYTIDEIRNKIRLIMAEEDINQIEFCRKTGIDPGHLSRFIRGMAGLGRTNYIRLTTYLKAYENEADEVVVVSEMKEVDAPEDSYELSCDSNDLSLEEIDGMMQKLSDMKRRKIQEKIDEIESEILRLYELQEKYEKLLKGES